MIEYCRLCGKPVERRIDSIAIRSRGRTGKTQYYHEPCIDAERMNNRREYFKQKHNKRKEKQK